MVLARQFIQVISNVFAHANFRLPEKIDRMIGTVLITPNLHHVHHHYQQTYTDSNYGDVLSIWDHIFGTFRRLEASKVVFGVDTCMDTRENAVFKQLLIIPFSGYRSPLEQTQTPAAVGQEQYEGLYQEEPPTPTAITA